LCVKTSLAVTYCDR